MDAFDKFWHIVAGVLFMVLIFCGSMLDSEQYMAWLVTAIVCAILLLIIVVMCGGISFFNEEDD